MIVGKRPKSAHSLYFAEVGVLKKVFGGRGRIYGGNERGKIKGMGCRGGCVGKRARKKEKIPKEKSLVGGGTGKKNMQKGG